MTSENVPSAKKEIILINFVAFVSLLIPIVLAHFLIRRLV